MKKFIDCLFVALMVFLPLSVTSCSDDDGNNAEIGTSIVGTWELIANEVDPIEAVEQGVVIPDDVGSVVEFTSDEVIFEDNVRGSWRIDRNLLYLITNSFPIPVALTILQLDDTTLITEMKITVYLFNEQIGNIEEVEATVQQTYKRIS